jgi:hypothetical protein
MSRKKKLRCSQDKKSDMDRQEVGEEIKHSKEEHEQDLGFTTSNENGKKGIKSSEIVGIAGVAKRVSFLTLFIL